MSDQKIIAFPVDYQNRVMFLVDTLLKNLTMDEIVTLNKVLVEKANEKYNERV